MALSTGVSVVKEPADDEHASLGVSLGVPQTRVVFARCARTNLDGRIAAERKAPAKMWSVFWSGNFVARGDFFSKHTYHRPRQKIARKT